MKSTTIAIALTTLLSVGGCAHELSQRKLVETQAAIDTAKKSERATNPEVALYVKYAHDQLAQARELMDDGKSKAAQRMLDRARVDAELALALAETARSRQEAQEAWQRVEDLKKEKSSNSNSNSNE